MSYTLKNFENHFPAQILARGKAYYNDGAVVNGEETDEGDWLFHVQGTELYEVEIGLNKKGKMKYSGCTCHYASENECCKHEAAALYYLREMNSINIPASKEKKEMQLSPAQLFAAGLLNVNKEVLTGFISEYAAEDKNFARRFTLYLKRKEAEANNDYAAIPLMIEETLIAASGGKYNWESEQRKNLARLFKPHTQMLTKAMKDKDLPLSFHLAAAFIKSLSPITKDTYESYSQKVVAIQNQGFTVIEELLKADMAFELKQAIHEWLWQEAAARGYNINDAGRIFMFLQPLVKNKAQEQKYINILQEILKAYSIPLKEYVYYTSPSNEEKTYLDLLFNFYIERNYMKEADELAIKNSERFEDYFKIALTYYLKNGKIDIADNMLQKKINSNRNYRPQYLPFLLAVAQQKNNKAEILQYAFDAYKQSGKMEYLTIYKSFFTSKEWVAEVELVGKKLKAGNFIPSVVFDFYLSENIIDKAFRVLERNGNLELLANRASVALSVDGNAYYKCFIEKVNKLSDWYYGYQSDYDAIVAILKTMQTEGHTKILEKTVFHINHYHRANRNLIGAIKPYMHILNETA